MEAVLFVSYWKGKHLCLHSIVLRDKIVRDEQVLVETDTNTCTLQGTEVK